MKRFIFIAILYLFICAIAPPEAGSEENPFPSFPVLEPNVSFWENVFTVYNTNECVIHDRKNLNIVYGIIQLDEKSFVSSRTNKKRIKNAKEKYRKVLRKLSSGKVAKTHEERNMVSLFGAEAKKEVYKKAIKNMRCQVGQKDRFERGLIRSGAYLDRIKKILKEYDLPSDLAYLPHVESSFNPLAYSRFGASGMWQFTRLTGKQYLKIGYTVDERRDPIRSTHAAAKLLKKNYEVLKDWPLAITAYNHGLNGALRALRSKGSYERVFKEYKSGLFKFASRNFYSEFLAVRNIAKNYKSYFGNLVLHTPPDIKEFSLKGFIAMSDLARIVDMDISSLHNLNPALRSPVFKGQKYIPKGYVLNIPTQKYDSLNDLLSDNLYAASQKRSLFYTVRKGETAGMISKKLDIPLEVLVAANNLDSRATIYVRQNLRIPDLSGKRVEITSLKKSSNTEKKVQAPKLAAPKVAAPKLATAKVAVPKEAAPKEVASRLVAPKVVAPKEVAAKVAAPEEGSFVEMELKIIAEEKLSPSLQSLTASLSPPEYSANPEIVEGNLQIERIWYDDQNQIGEISVEVEETLGHYADWLKVSSHEIRKLNGFSERKMITIHQKIKIPLHKVSGEKFEEERYEYHKELVEDFFETYKVVKVDSYNIRKGDNIWTLSNDKFQIPLWLIRRYNSNIDLNALFPSQTLLVPVIEKSV